MKLSLFAFLFMSCLGFCSMGQNYFSLTSAQTNKVYTGFEAVTNIAMKLHNSTPTSKNYVWERTDICPMPSGWSALVCDCDNCYTAETYLKPSTGSVVDSCSIVFSYYFDFGASLGSHTTKFVVRDPTNPSSWDEIFLTINNGCPTSIEDRIQLNSLVVSLNNLEGAAYIQTLLETNGIQMVVNDLSGRVLNTYKTGRLTSGEKVYLDMSLKGIFIVTIYTQAGQKIGSYKMCKP
jgi:hypothetical protein